MTRAAGVSLLALSFASAVSVAAQAADEIKSAKWEFTTQMQLPGAVQSASSGQAAGGNPPRQHDHPRRATLRIYDSTWFLAEGMVSTWTQRSSCHSSNPSAPVFALMRRAITMASVSFSQATPWI